MRFNWNNNRMMVGSWPMLAGGEFIIRCLGLSRYVIPIADSNDVREMISQRYQENIYDRRYDMIVSYRPEGMANQGSDWHKNFLNSANWLDTDRLFLEETSGRKIYGRSSWFSTTLWTDAHLASRGFYDRFWRIPTCELSWTDIGINVKTHVPSEVEGVKHLMPQARVWSLDNFNRWKSWCEQNKVATENLSVWKSYEEYEPITTGFIFQMDDLIWSARSFSEQMEAAYQYFGLDDYHLVQEHLLMLRSNYINWNDSFGANRLEI